ncbi:MAG: Cysteine-tRNA ligase [Parcubacteria group bacterium GW2011_GWA2_51_12]|nr:MAG: Cysteine-tRNA ligase [Parcubacteria group bacterium GW2011_GWA2_51_12]
MKLYNTLTRRKDEFKALEDKQVKLYTCGPTVYDYAHIGNLRAFLFADLLKRAMVADGYRVTHIMNITDVGHLTGDRDMGEDKMEKASAEHKKTAWDVASFFTEAFLSDIRKLNIITPDRLPKATAHIKEMIALIETLEKKGFTYRTADGIYFDTGKLSDYGKLARLDLSGLREGARVEANPEKRSPTDFALWKFSPENSRRQMEWQSPWGIGFPGWHIECSAMSVRYLGQPFDIHTGGIDHIPVHHTNEIAQTEAATGKPLANFWLHSEFVMVSETRMGKSEGNLITLDEVQKKGYSPLAYRYFVLQGHYRTKLNFSWQAMDSAQNTLDRLYATITEYGEPKIGCAEFEQRFYQAINDDLDTPKALAVMWEMIDSKYPSEAKLKSLYRFDEILGLSLKLTRDELRHPLPPEIKKLVAEREEMRKKKDWKRSDALREKIEKAGYVIKDTEKGPLVRKQTSSS